MSNNILIYLILLTCSVAVISMVTTPQPIATSSSAPLSRNRFAEMAPKNSSAKRRRSRIRLRYKLMPTGNPLRDQPNLSVSSRNSKNKLIRGSKNVVTLTRMKYLRKDWCKTELFTQVIREEGCLKRKIINRFCYGQCNSFFIPKSNKVDDLSPAFQSCSNCLPKKWSWVSFTLRCPGARPHIKHKKIQVVKQCRCMPKMQPQTTVEKNVALNTDFAKKNNDETET